MSNQETTKWFSDSDWNEFITNRNNPDWCYECWSQRVFTEEKISQANQESEVK